MIGQFVGIAALVVTSAVAALAVIAVPGGWVALLGFVPLGLGIHKAWQFCRGADLDVAVANVSELRERSLQGRGHSQVFQ